MNVANRIAAAQRCLFGSAERQCGERAIVHVLQTDGAATMDCVEHSEWWVTREYADIHEISGACGLPGTTWRSDGCIVEGVAGG